MPTNNSAAVKTLHRLLFRALIEIRAQGLEHKNKLVFHLADLFHNTVLDLENAAEGKIPYEEALKKLRERAGEKGLERWLDVTSSQLREPGPENAESAPG
jgi:hypothetical protein